jgi:8-oxo-dGTP diphosphatase
MRYPPNPKLAVDAVWVSKGRVLLVRRGRPPFVGRWALPGGYVEGSETVESAVSRELREETGLAARPQRLVGVFSGPDRDPRGPNVSVTFWMRGRAGRPVGGDDAREAAWVPLSEARDLAFDHDEILRRALGRGGARRRTSPPRRSGRRHRRNDRPSTRARGSARGARR